MPYQPADYAGYPPQMPAATHHQQASFQSFPPPPPPPSQPLQQAPPPQTFPSPLPQLQQPSPPSSRLTKTSIHNLQTSQLILTITRKSAYGIPNGLGLSSKSLIEITNPSTSEIIGTLKFHEKTGSGSSSIDFTLRNSSSKLKNEGSGFGRDKWAFQRIAGPEKWYWIMESGSKGVLRDQKKDGQVIARLEDGWLVIEKFGMSDVGFEEIFVTSVAVMEKARRNKKDSEEAEGVAEVISALAGG